MASQRDIASSTESGRILQAAGEGLHNNDAADTSRSCGFMMEAATQFQRNDKPKQEKYKDAPVDNLEITLTLFQQQQAEHRTADAGTVQGRWMETLERHCGSQVNA